MIQKLLNVLINPFLTHPHQVRRRELNDGSFILIEQWRWQKQKEEPIPPAKSAEEHVLYRGQIYYPSDHQEWRQVASGEYVLLSEEQWERQEDAPIHLDRWEEGKWLYENQFVEVPEGVNDREIADYVVKEKRTKKQDQVSRMLDEQGDLLTGNENKEQTNADVSVPAELEDQYDVLFRVRSQSDRSGDPLDRQVIGQEENKARLKSFRELVRANSERASNPSREEAGNSSGAPNAVIVGESGMGKSYLARKTALGIADATVYRMQASNVQEVDFRQLGEQLDKRSEEGPVVLILNDMQHAEDIESDVIEFISLQVRTSLMMTTTDGDEICGELKRGGRTEFILQMEDYQLDEYQQMLQLWCSQDEELPPPKDDVFQPLLDHVTLNPQKLLRVLTGDVKGLVLKENADNITEDLVRRAIGQTGYTDGLSRINQKILQVIARQEPIRGSALTQIVGVSQAALENVHEPILQDRGLIDVSSSGRQLTGKGEDFVRTNLSDSSETPQFHEVGRGRPVPELIEKRITNNDKNHGTE